MCGISISISKNNISVTDLIKQNNVISHRGPDDEGYVLFENSFINILGGADTPENIYLAKLPYNPKVKINNLDGNYFLGFGHRRLSILDLSEFGHQPMSYDNNRYWITFNGEVYNYLEIKEELIQLGYQFITETDTEVILASYKKWGAECQNKFNGMWAFGIYDTLEKSIFISRDRFGIKPLYYWFSPNNDLHFGSEIKQFTQVEGWKAVMNSQRVHDYLFYALTDHTNETFFNGVFSVPPGSFAQFKIENFSRKLDFTKWYKPKLNNFRGNYKDACNEFEILFKKAVSLNTRADVKVGTALSGGLDSSAVVCVINNILSEQNKSTLQETFSSCSNNPLFDEKKWIDFVTSKTNVKSNIIYPDANEIFSETEKIIWHLDEPYQSQSAFLGFNIFRQAKINDVKVLLNGQGADEYLSGYEEFNLFRKLVLLKKFRWKKLVHELKNDNNLSIFQFIKYSLFQSLPIFIKNKSHYFNETYKLLDCLVNKTNFKYKKINPIFYIQLKANSLPCISHNQLLINPLQKYLRWEDRNSMAHSVEARVPFLDHNLVEFASQLPVDFLDELNYNKKILRDSLKDILPNEIKNRPDKKGFITPEEDWFKNTHFEQFKNLLLENLKYSKGIFNENEVVQFFDQVRLGEIQFDYTYWRIISICIWMKSFQIELDR